MKTNRFSIYALLLSALVVLIACGIKSGPSDFELAKLLGTWSIVDGAKTQTETWSIEGDGLKGIGVVLNNNDTTFIEELAINRENNSLIYLAKVSGQNENLPIQFHLENQSATMIAFANYNHDFPQRIVYELLDENNLQVYIEGPRDGEKIRIVMDFKRLLN